MTLTITQPQFDIIAQTIAPMNIPKGLGTGKDACTMAAINIALGGCRVDTVPACMSPVIGAWIIRIQDATPDVMRNSLEWKALVPFAAGTGREHETQRLAIIYDHMWQVSLPLFLPVAIKFGFESAWQKMLKEKTSDAAASAAASARTASAVADEAASAAHEVYSAYAAADASSAEAAYASYAAHAAMAEAADAAAAAAAEAAYAASASVPPSGARAAADAAAYVAAEVAADAWNIISPINLLRQLIEITHKIEAVS